MPIDWRKTDERSVQELRSNLRPVHYRELFRRSLVGLPDNYGPKTDWEEKFRQRYDEHPHPTILNIPGGNLALRYWFPVAHQPQLLAPEPLVINGCCLVSYNAGYEHAKREPYLKDWYGDGASKQRRARRMLGFQFESHVRDYYLKNWPQFCEPPTNHEQWQQPADNDFLVKLPDGAFYKVDTKTPSYQGDIGENRFKARRIVSSVIYVAGFWNLEQEVAMVQGIIPGKWLTNVAGLCHGDHFGDNCLMSFEVLSVMLNMAQCGMVPSYRDAFSQIWKRQELVTARALGRTGNPASGPPCGGDGTLPTSSAQA